MIGECSPAKTFEFHSLGRMAEVKESMLYLGVERIDKAIGPLRTGKLYEIYGESATCKTTFCLQYSLQVMQ